MILRCLLAALVLGGCVQSGTSTDDPARQSATWSWELPFYFPTPKVPSDNPMSEAKFQLGRALFYDVRLSGNGQQSCASCHEQGKAFTDGRAVATGSTGEHTPRNAQNLANVAWHSTYTWANPALVTLERQMEVPLFAEHLVEMGVNDQNKATVLARFQADRDYVQRFAEVFPGEPIGFSQIIKAIATFQRGLISAASKYDQYLQGKATLSAAELRGKDLFFGEQAECFHCHGSFNFNDQVVHAGSGLAEALFHNTGLYNIDGKGDFPEPYTHQLRPMSCAITKVW
jgi:cytochrome c peroxidase